MKKSTRLVGLLTALTATSFSIPDAKAQPFLTNGLVAYYPFNGNANDAVGTNHGTVFGATLATDRFGNTNQAYYFNGTTSYIQIAASTDVFGSQAFSVSIWFNPLTIPKPAIPSQAACFLISKGQNNFELSTGSATSGTGMHFLPRLASGNDWNTPASTYQTNVWQQVIAIYKPSSNTVQVFLNGVLLPLIGPVNTPVGLDNSTPARLGRRTDGTLAFNGFLDSVRIYNRALSASEVAQLYQYESGLSVALVKAVKPLFANLYLGTNYQLQVSGDLSTWTNQGLPFTATNSEMAYPQYWDVDNWGRLFFRLKVSQ